MAQSTMAPVTGADLDLVEDDPLLDDMVAEAETLVIRALFDEIVRDLDMGDPVEATPSHSFHETDAFYPLGHRIPEVGGSDSIRSPPNSIGTCNGRRTKEMKKRHIGG